MGGILMTFVGFIFIGYRWMLGCLRASEAVTQAKFEEVHARTSRMKEDLTQFRIEVAKYYASEDRLTMTENKLTAAIDKLVSRFDRFATDFHSLFGQNRKDG